MNPVLSWILGILGPLIGGVAMWLLNRAVVRVDTLEESVRAQASALHKMELQIAKELPTKEDFTDLRREVQSVSVTMHEVRDMVIRLEERHKSNV